MGNSGKSPLASDVFSLFTYGSLMLPEVMIKVCGCRFSAEKATLSGYGRYLVKNEVFPAIVMEKDACTEGLLYRGIDRKSLDRLDTFEGTLYRRKQVAVTLTDGSTVDCHAYVISDCCRNLLSDRLWDAELFRVGDLASFLGSLSADM